MIAARHQGTHISITGNVDTDEHPLYFAITSADGYGIESTATQEFQADILRNHQHYGAAKILVCNDNKINLGETTKKTDAKIAEVETLQGTVIKRYFINDNKVNISTLPAGTYRLSGVNQRGSRHLLGTFTKKENKKNRKKLRKNLVESKKCSTFALAIQK